jgi:hypothetical protein
MLDTSFIQIIITHVIFTCEGNQKKKPFLDVGYFIHSNHHYPYHLHMWRKQKKTLFGCWIFHSFKSSIPISYAHAEEIRKPFFWMLDISFIQIIDTRIICTCGGNKKTFFFWMLDISFIQIIDTHIMCTCGGNRTTFFWMLDISFIQIIDTRIICTYAEEIRKHFFWMLDISFIQIIDTRLICTCVGNKKNIFFLDVGHFIHSNHWYPYHVHMRRK